jgi:hypothetical protein
MTGPYKNMEVGKFYRNPRSGVIMVVESVDTEGRWALMKSTMSVDSISLYRSDHGPFTPVPNACWLNNVIVTDEVGYRLVSGPSELRMAYSAGVAEQWAYRNGEDWVKAYVNDSRTPTRVPAEWTAPAKVPVKVEDILSGSIDGQLIRSINQKTVGTHSTHTKVVDGVVEVDEGSFTLRRRPTFGVSALRYASENKMSWRYDNGTIVLLDMGGRRVHLEDGMVLDNSQKPDMVVARLDDPDDPIVAAVRALAMGKPITDEVFKTIKKVLAWD